MLGIEGHVCMKPTVAHVHEQFLAISETFIYQFLRNAKAIRPVPVYCQRTNADVFPWDDFREVVYAKKYSLNTLATGLLRKSRLRPAATTMTGPYCKALGELKPDLVHAHFGPDGCKVMYACEQLNIPFVVSFYGYDLSQLVTERFWQEAYRELFARAAGVIALSEDFRRRLLGIGCPAEKIHIIRIGVNPEDFPYRPSAPGRNKPVRILSVARCVEKKGIDYGLEALAIVRKQYPNVQFTHIGDGPLREEWQTLATKLGIADCCDWRGSQPRPVVQDEMKRSDIFMQPSIRASNGDEEGTPVVLYEAMATGLPIVSTLHSGIPEAVLNGENGYLAPERDADTLAANILRLLEQPDDWEDMGRRGRELVVERFDGRAESEKLEDLYSTLLR